MQKRKNFELALIFTNLTRRKLAMISKKNNISNRQKKVFFKISILAILLLFIFPLFFGCSTTEKTATMHIGSNFTYNCDYNAETNKTRVVWSTYFNNNSIYNISEINVKFNLYFEESLVYEDENFSYNITIEHGKQEYKNCYFYIEGQIDKIEISSWDANYDDLWNSYKGWWIVTIIATIILSIVVLTCILGFELDLEECWPWVLSFGIPFFIISIIGFSIDSIGWVASCIVLGGVVIVGLIGLISFLCLEIFDFEATTIALIILSIVALAGIICGCIFWKWWAVLIIATIIALGIGIFFIIKNNKEKCLKDNDITIEDLYNCTVEELKNYCYQNNIAGYSKLRKNELIELIMNPYITPEVKDLYNQNEIKEYNNISKPSENENNKNNQTTDLQTHPSIKKTQTYSTKNGKITFDDIAGLEKAKEAFKEKVIMPFEHPELYKKYGKKVGGGILLYGLPGTGKTMFAEAASNEIDALFIPIKCSDIKSKWYGESEQKVKNIFLKAKKVERAIIFFDEFEAIGSKRTNDTDNLNNNLVPEILAEMQGFGSGKSNSTIVVIAATNKPWSIDSAFLRPGRFDEKIYIPLPDEKARKKMFELKLKDIPSINLDFDQLSEITEGFNGADINEFCEKLKMKAIKKSLKSNDEYLISMEDVMEVSKVIKSSVSQEDIDSLESFEASN